MNLRIALTALVALSLAACGGDDDGPSVAPRRGSISITPRALSASFADEREVRHLEDSTRSVGDCVVRRWRTDPASAAGREVSAGTLTATGAEACTASPDAEYFCEAALWDPTESRTVTITATGDDVPEFTLEVTTPVRPELTLPPASSVSDDLVLRWTGGSGSVRAMAGAATVMDEGSYVGLSVICDADAASGELTVPASVLAEMLAYDPGGTALRSLMVLAVGSATTRAGDYEIEAFASEYLGATRVVF